MKNKNKFLMVWLRCRCVEWKSLDGFLKIFYLKWIIKNKLLLFLEDKDVVVQFWGCTVLKGLFLVCFISVYLFTFYFILFIYLYFILFYLLNNSTIDTAQ